MIAIPKILKNFNLFVNGRGFAGLCDEVTLPTLDLTLEEHRAGGMDGSIPIDMGMEPLEMSFTMAEYSPTVFRQFGLSDQSSVDVIFRGALADNNGVTPLVVTGVGMLTTIDGGTTTLGQKVTMDTTLRLSYYRLQIAGVTEIEIDLLNMVRIIGGVDQLAAVRNALNL